MSRGGKSERCEQVIASVKLTVRLRKTLEIEGGRISRVRQGNAGRLGLP